MHTKKPPVKGRFLGASPNAVELHQPLRGLMVVVLEKRAKVINMSMLLMCGVLLGLMFAGFMSTAFSVQSGLREVR